MLFSPVVTCCVLSLPGSVPSLAAGLLFGGLAGFGAYQISNDPTNVWVSLGWYTISANNVFCCVDVCMIWIRTAMCPHGQHFPHYVVSSSYIGSSNWCDGKEVLRIQKVHASRLGGWSKVSVSFCGWSDFTRANMRTMISVNKSDRNSLTMTTFDSRWIEWILLYWTAL